MMGHCPSLCGPRCHCPASLPRYAPATMFTPTEGCSITCRSMLPRDMGAQLTIAVYLQADSFSAQQPLNTFSVLGQSLSVMIAANELKSMQMADVLVTVPLQKYDALDYDKAAEMIHLGYEAAEGKSAILSKLAVDDSTWKQYVEQREGRTRQTPIPQFIAVTGTTPHLAKQDSAQAEPGCGQAGGQR